MSAAVVVGVDIGTSNTKALVVGAEPDDPSTYGREVLDADVPTRWQEVGGRSHTTAEDLYDDALRAVTAALRLAADRFGTAPAVRAVGVTGMGESGVLLGPDGAPLGTVVSWFDPRGGAEMAALPADVREALPAVTGLPVSPLATLAKLLWWRGQGVLAGPGTCWLNVPEYVAHRLGGQRAAEPSLASRTGLLDVGTLQWWEPALAAAGATPDLLPPLVPAGTSLGRASGDDLPPGLAGAHVVVAGHDHPAAAYGAGAWGPDDLFDSCGTAESLVRVVPRPPTPQQRARLVTQGLTSGAHVLEDRWVVSGPTRGGLVLRRVLGVLGAREPGPRSALDETWAPGAGTGVEVTGAAMSDETVRIRVTGEDAGPADVWAAALRHAGSAVTALAASIDAEVGPRRAVVAAGGWTRLRSVREAKALDLPDVSFSPRRQAGAYAAATLAAWAAAGRRGSAVDFAAQLTAPHAPAPPPATEGALT